MAEPTFDVRELQIRGSTNLLDFLTEQRGADPVAVHAAFFAGACLAMFGQEACIESCRRSAADARVPASLLQEVTDQALRWAIDRPVRR